MKLIDKRDAKALNAILYFARNVKHPTITKILKLLYLLDFMHFKETGRPVTGQKYYAWDLGPVPKDIYFRINNLKKEDEWYNSLVLNKEVIDEVSDKRIHMVLARKKPDLSVFTKREKKLLEQIAYIFKNVRPKDISDYSHLKNHPWDITINEKGEKAEIDYLLAIDDSAPLTKEEAEELYKEIEEVWEKFGSD